MKVSIFKFFWKQGPQVLWVHTVYIHFTSFAALFPLQTPRNMKIHSVLLIHFHHLTSHYPHHFHSSSLISSFSYLEIFLNSHHHLGLFDFVFLIHFYSFTHYSHCCLYFFDFKVHFLFLIQILNWNHFANFLIINLAPFWFSLVFLTQLFVSILHIHLLRL